MESQINEIRLGHSGQCSNKNHWTSQKGTKMAEPILESLLKTPDEILFVTLFAVVYKSWQISAVPKTAASLFPLCYVTFLIGANNNNGLNVS